MNRIGYKAICEYLKEYKESADPAINELLESYSDRKQREVKHVIAPFFKENGPILGNVELFKALLKDSLDTALGCTGSSCYVDLKERFPDDEILSPEFLFDLDAHEYFFLKKIFSEKNIHFFSLTGNKGFTYEDKNYKKIIISFPPSSDYHLSNKQKEKIQKLFIRQYRECSRRENKKNKINLLFHEYLISILETRGAPFLFRKKEFLTFCSSEEVDITNINIKNYVDNFNGLYEEQGLSIVARQTQGIYEFKYDEEIVNSFNESSFFIENEEAEEKKLFLKILKKTCNNKLYKYIKKSTNAKDFFYSNFNNNRKNKKEIEFLLELGILKLINRSRGQYAIKRIEPICEIKKEYLRFFREDKENIVLEKDEGFSHTSIMHKYIVVLLWNKIMELIRNNNESFYLLEKQNSIDIKTKLSIDEVQEKLNNLILFASKFKIKLNIIHLESE